MIWDRITKNGHTLYRRDWALLADAMQAAQVSTYVVQGSWSGVAASAGTHSGGGAMDLSVRGLTEEQALRLVDELRKRNCAAWLRSPKFGWPAKLGGAHVHLIVKDSPGLSPAARAQVRAYDLGRNGLANGKHDPHHRPVQHAFGVAAYPGPIKFGDRGEAVKSIQLHLGVTPTGYFGALTKRKVTRFQRLRPRLWPADGVVGPKTYAAITGAK